MRYVRWIWSFWRPHRWWLIVLILLTLVSSGVAIGYPMVFKYLLDDLNRVLASHNPELARSTAWRLAGLMGAIGLARCLAQLYPGFRAMLNSRIERDVREKYFRIILERDFAFFNHFRTGDLVTRLTDDIGGFPKIAWFSCSGIFRAVESGSKFAFCLWFMLAMNWQLALLAILPLPLMMAVFYRIRTAMSQRALERQQAISRTNDMLEAAFSGIRIVKAFNAEAAQVRAMRAILDDRIEVETRVQRMMLGMQNLFWAMQFAGQIIVVVAGGMRVLAGTLTMGEFYAFYVYLTMLVRPLMDIPNLFVTSRQAFACIDREIELEEWEKAEQPSGVSSPQSEVRGPRSESELGSTNTNAAAHTAPDSGLRTSDKALVDRMPLELIHSLCLKDISFCYDPGLPNALDGVSLELHAGEKVAIVGSVGSGKTTLLKVAAGIIPPGQGEMLVNGQPLETFARAQWRKHVGYIPQEANLFSESVASNVSFGRPLDINQVRRALELARVLDEMEGLPDGIEEVLGQRGLTVSGGQKQRLAIARAVAGRPDLLLMDDCTSALDAENERVFWDLLGDQLPGAMCLIVTHRLATARVADRIYVLDGGRVVGHGTHMELLETCEVYRNFLTREELEAALGVEE
jgi:ATP-binding cassette subfamily B protein